MTVSIERTAGGSVFEESFEIAAGGRVLKRDAITESGDYEIELSVGTAVAERWTISLPDEGGLPLGAYSLTIRIDEAIELFLLHADPAPPPPGC